MDNAANALVIAGAVLISVIIIGALILGFTQLQDFPRLQEENRRLEQLERFNREYLSYDKARMYGTDVITVINKAMSNNKKFEDYESVYDINIVFTLRTDLTSTATVYIPSTDENGNRDGKMDIIVEDKGTCEGYKLGVVFESDTQFNLLSEPDKNGDRMNDKIEELLSLPETIKVPGGDEWNYTIIDPGFKQFKRKLFKCTDVSYNVETGRVSEMVFEEISTTTN